jgi:hypothetical protein
MTKPPDLDPDFVRDISLAVYLERLGPDGAPKAIKEAGGIEVLRKRAGSYDALTKAYLRALNVTPPALLLDMPNGKRAHVYLPDKAPCQDPTPAQTAAAPAPQTPSATAAPVHSASGAASKKTRPPPRKEKARNARTKP